MRTRTFFYLALISLGFFFSSSALFARPVVVSYVVEVQEKRKSTRWTLTEWLRIKERMKLMDVWLAMFSKPKEDKFTPELNLSYVQNTSKLNLDAAGNEEKGSLSGSTITGQLWLTNIVSSSIGIRTLNIDLGMEGALRSADGFEPEDSPPVSWGRELNRTYFTGSLRLWGKHIQDSSLVLKGGKYDMKNTVAKRADDDLKTAFSGVMAGAELQLYFFKWFGIEAHYFKFGGEKSLSGGEEDATGSYFDYLAYIEISLLRMMGGKFQESWKMPPLTGEEKKYATTEEGYVIGAKLMF